MKKSKEIRIIFLGTPEFASIILQGLVENNYKPILVITAPDKPTGRKKIITGPPVKITAQKYNIPIEQPKKIHDSLPVIQNSKPDIIISAAYGQIIPKNILEIPKYGCINVHPSLLPKYRGPSPIQNAILSGDKKTGVTIYLMDEKIDHGPIISNIQFPIFNKDTYQSLSKKLAELGAELLIKTIPEWINGKIKPEPQNESKATYTKIIKKRDGKIDWKKSAQEIERQIRAFNPWPGSFTFFKKNSKKLRVKILEVDVSKNEMPGKLCLKCKKDYLIIKKLQPEGKREMTGEEFLRGYNGYNIIF